MRLLLDLGASVVVGDQQPVPLPPHAALAFHPTNVASWPDLQALFAAALARHGGRLDHVFANAGISGPGTTYLDDAFDPATGALLEPPSITYDVNFRGVINTAYLGLHHMRHQPEAATRRGSVVCTSSAVCFQRFRFVDYATSKHAVLGFMRGVATNLIDRGLPLRINCVAPSFTNSAMLPEALFAAAGHPGLLQPAEAVARSALLLMADDRRQGQVIFSSRGQFAEIEESRLRPLAIDIVGSADLTEDAVFANISEHVVRKAQQELAEAEAGKEAAARVGEAELQGGKSLDTELGGPAEGGGVV